jgi:hypothetical protein
VPQFWHGVAVTVAVAVAVFDDVLVAVAVAVAVPLPQPLPQEPAVIHGWPLPAGPLFVEGFAPSLQ